LNSPTACLSPARRAEAPGGLTTKRLPAQRENINPKGAAMSKLSLTKEMTSEEYDAELARLKACLDAAGCDNDLLGKIAEDMLALCDAATISEVPGLGIPKVRKPKRMS
jgi:hypothetical protein